MLVSLYAFRGLRFFSPSKLAVSINAIPPSFVVASKIKSDGKKSYDSTFTISPITTLLHSTLVNFPSLNTAVFDS